MQGILTELEDRKFGEAILLLRETLSPRVHIADFTKAVQEAHPLVPSHVDADDVVELEQRAPLHASHGVSRKEWVELCGLPDSGIQISATHEWTLQGIYSLCDDIVLLLRVPSDRSFPLPTVPFHAVANL